MAGERKALVGQGPIVGICAEDAEGGMWWCCLARTACILQQAGVKK